MGLEIVNVAETVLLIHQSVDYDQVRGILELYHRLHVLGGKSPADESVDVCGAGEFCNDRVFIAEGRRAGNIVGAAIEELYIELLLGGIYAECAVKLGKVVG